MIAIVNYGLGNIQAIANIYKRLNIPVVVATTPDDLAKSDKIILPGVGAFDWAMQLLNESGMRYCLEELVMVKRLPIFGICVGMQMLARRSDEGKLDWFGGYSIILHAADNLRVYKSSLPDNTIILEYEVHGTVPHTGKPELLF